MLHDLRRSSPLISALFVWIFRKFLLRFGAGSRAIYEDLCSFEVIARPSCFRRQDELRDEFRGEVEGAREGGLWERGTGDLVFF